MTYTVQIPAMSDAQIDNFWAKVQPTGFCWDWTAATNSAGYGLFNIKSAGTKLRAHRISYTLLVGPIAPELEIDHLCRNRRCVNPDHLEPVTGRVNRTRVHKTSRALPPWVTSGKSLTGACIRGHAYTEENTYTRKNGGYECRTCKAQAKTRARRAAA